MGGSTVTPTSATPVLNEPRVNRPEVLAPTLGQPRFMASNRWRSLTEIIHWRTGPEIPENSRIGPKA
jgi:hypothetical protein